MSLSNFTVPKKREYQSLPDGRYTAQIDHMEYIYNDFGNYHLVNWKILSPSEFEGKVHQERFNIEHENETVREIAIGNFGDFCMEIGQLNEGDHPTEDNFLFKVATIMIRNKIGKDGKKYTNVVKRELVGTQGKQEASSTPLNGIVGIAGSGMVALQATTPIQPLNDEVPF